MNGAQIATLAMGALMITPILAAPVMREPITQIEHVKQHNTYELRAWRLFDNGEAEAMTQDHRLIGFACGEDRLTMTAAEEDHFPTCEAIEAIADVCPEDMRYPPEPVTAAECARYMGDGW